MLNRVLKSFKIWFFCVVLLGAFVLFRTDVHASSADVQEDTKKESQDQQKEPQKEQTVKIKKLNKTKITSIAATNKGTVQLKWNKVKNANRYRIYRKKSGQKKYTLIKTTTKTTYTDKNGKANVVYYYYIKPIKLNENKKVAAAGDACKARKCKVRKKNPKVAYAGDSIMTGFTCYNILKDRDNSRVFAAVSMTPKKYLSSQEMKDLLKYNPDRLYIMMGVNGLWSSDSKWLNSMWEDYEKILKKCREKNKNMEIVVVGVAPVGKNASVSKSAVNKFNKILKENVKKKTGMYYCDIGPDLADSTGYIRSKYSAKDGVHWQVSTYRYVLGKWDKFSEKIYY